MSLRTAPGAALLLGLLFASLGSAQGGGAPSQTPAKTPAPVFGPVLGPPRPPASAEGGSPMAGPGTVPGGALAAFPGLAPGEVFLRGFEPDGKHQVRLGGTRLPDALVAIAERAGNVLMIQAPELGGVVLVSPRTKAVLRVEASRVAEELDGSLAVRIDPPPAELGSFELSPEGMRFPVEGKEVELRDAPYLLGPHTGAQLWQENPAYRFRSRNYSPVADVMAQLATVRSPIKVRVFFGSWCHFCSERIPRMLRVELGLAGSGLEFEYFGLPSPFKDVPEAKKHEIKGVPTCIVLSGDRELGRFRGELWGTPEVSLWNVLREAGRLGG